ncbi:MAG: CoA transferase [Syntrophales bacterium]|nr:CoA transferase [Syntrophales bacterium]MDY0043723.1 CoA transferase [Syntrophales bacterium]
MLPLQGINIVEFTTSWVGPGGGGLLCEMGADVIKIENPRVPDYWRRAVKEFHETGSVNRSGGFAMNNRGKRSCALDLKNNNENLEAARKIIRRSDILITNFAPRVMNSLGLGYEALQEINPDLIMIAASGYGATGPDRDAVAFGVCLEPYAGLSSLIGYSDSPPLPCGTTLSDLAGQVLVAYTALVALHHRRITGEGQYIDISEVESLLACMPEAVMEYSMNGTVPVANGNRDELMAPHGCYRCAGEDKWIAIAIKSDKEWQSLCRAMDHSDLASDERFQDAFLRFHNQDELDTIISQWTKDKKPVDLMIILQKEGIISGPVYSGEEIFNDPHLRSRNLFFEHVHPEVGKKELPGPFAKLSETPWKVRGADPLFGQHTEEILKELEDDDSQKV